MRRFDVILVGGGHANIAVLADWVRKGTPGGGHAALLTPQPFLTYSGMVPGWLAGRYQREDGRVDLAALCQRAGVEPRARFRELLVEYASGYLRGPFNIQARLLAGFDEDELASLQALAP